MKILVIDVGGTNVKVLATGHTDRVKIPSGPKMTAEQMVTEVKKVVADWDYDAVSIGYPGFVFGGRPICEPANLGPGWVGYDFKKEFGCRVRVINDAAMQALGSYHGGRMLYLGFGTGLGSAMVTHGIPEAMEIAHLVYKKGKTYEDFVGARALDRLGKKKWRANVGAVINQLRTALDADYVVLGGGNAKLLEELPPDTILGDNRNAFIGGYRLWDEPAARSVQLVKTKTVAQKRTKSKRFTSDDKTISVPVSDQPPRGAKSAVK